jgi:hypothetical protein
MAINPARDRDALLQQMYQKKMYNAYEDQLRAQADTTGMGSLTELGDLGGSGGLLGYLMKLLMDNQSQTPWGMQGQGQAQVPGQFPGMVPGAGVDEEMYPWYMPPGEERDVY